MAKGQKVPDAAASEPPQAGKLLEAAGLHCPHAERCPGCPLLSVSYADGLELKTARVSRAVGRYPELLGVVPEGVSPADPVSGYRIRAKLVTDAQGRLGLFAAHTHTVVDTPECRVLAPELHAAAAGLRGLLPLDIPLRGVDLRLCDRGVLVSLIVEGRPEAALLERSRERVLAALPLLAGLAVNFTRPGAVQLLGPELEILHGADAEPHHFSPDAPWHYASHGAFTQVHLGQTTRLHARIEATLTEHLGSLAGRRVLELYAGSGALGLRLAARGAQVSAVECFEPALRRLRQAATLQSLAIETHATDAEMFLDELRLAPGPAFAAVIVNPPRRGLSPGVRRAIAELGPKLIVYVSCEPETLARDLGHLRTLGWSSAPLAAFDMIPLSDAVECLAVLRQASVPEPRVLFEDEQALALFKPPFEAMAATGQPGKTLLDRARQALGLPELSAVQHLDATTSGVCWFARRASDVVALTSALAQGEHTYLALASGVTHKKGKITRPLFDAGKKRSALTRYRRQDVIGGHSLLELQLGQARKHQLRRHLAAVGHAILGDERYGQQAANRHFEHRHGLDRTFLHCSSSRLLLGTRQLEVRAELPGDLAAVLDSLSRARLGPAAPERRK
jgi:tRNA/tmRNA/rRNA uracil-C5-methylase (TrmA/RlmC/RlmD family)/23S rRNA-/tRNA-specific pseudouridylate synthase